MAPGQDDFAVVIPTWLRPEALQVCLAALARQTLRPQRVIVPIKSDDEMTVAALGRLPAECDGLNVVAVPTSPQGNLVTQLNAGIAATVEQFVALTDDDAEPRPEWLRQLADGFCDPAVTCIGGRDWQPFERGSREVVGRISSFGRVVGNHHLGTGAPRSVDLLKGVNWAFRGDVLRAVGIDVRLRGRGNVTHWEMPLSFTIRQLGLTLIYDPAIVVDHHIAVRHDGDVNSRGGFEVGSFVDSVHNETLAVLDYLSPLNCMTFAAWALLVGTNAVPGLAQLPRLAWRRTPLPLARWRATLRGRWAGWKTFRANRDDRRRMMNGLATTLLAGRVS